MIQITHVELYKLNIPMIAPMVISIGTISEARNICVRVHTSEGIYGVGECAPFWMIVGETQETCWVVAQDFAKLLIGKNPLHIEDCLAELDFYLAGNPTVKSAFDMALYDIASKVAKLPLYAFLSGSKRMLKTDETIYIATPDAMAADALKIKERGAEAIKVKLGTDAKTDIARVEAIRNAIDVHIPIRTDANQGWDYSSAKQVLKTIENWNVEYCEQPVKHWDHAGLKRLRGSVSVPICADESVFTPADAFKLAAAEAVDYFNIKFSKSGGIANALKINAIAEAAGIRCMIGCMSESRLALTANAHFASARRNVVFYDLDSAFEHAADPVVGGAIYRNHYEVHLPETPGIGADFDDSFLKNMEKTTVR